MRTDALVIGGGTAGLRVALRLARGGVRTVLVEPRSLGGTCLNTGCIPTKALLEASGSYRDLHHLDEIGIRVDGKVDFSRLMRRVHAVVEDGRAHIKESLPSRHLTVLRGSARFVGKRTVAVGKRRIDAERIVIATGAGNVAPSIPGLPSVGYLTHEDILRMRTLPRSILMVGGGYISMELATFFSDLGCAVTVIERHDRVLRRVDPDVVGELMEYYRIKGVRLLTNVDVVEAHAGNNKKYLTVEHHSHREIVGADEIVVAIGRRPQTAHLGLDAAGVKTRKNGAIIVDSRLRTANRAVHAIGDCNGNAMFAHAARREMESVVDQILHERRAPIDAHIPWAVFTHPPVAGVGLSEEEARERHFHVGVKSARFQHNVRALIRQQNIGLAKIIYSKPSKKILGAAIFGPDADLLIQEVAAVMNSSSPTVDALEKTPHIHPTTAEVFNHLLTSPAYRQDSDAAPAARARQR